MQQVEEPKAAKAPSSYQSIAVFVLTAILIFIGLNLLSLAAIKLKKEKSNDVSDKIIRTNFKTVYPKYNQAEIKALWKETVSRSFEYDPYTQFRERPYQGKYIRIDRAGFRHNKHQAPWPPQKDHFNIFFFGGSTGFGWGVSDEETVASHLEDLFLSNPASANVSIYNFSQGAFFSLQERALLEQLILSGNKPDMAIFFDGLNECSLNEPLHTESLKLYFNGKIVSPFSGLPITKIITRMKKYADRRQERNSESEPEITRQTIDRYLANKTMTEKIAESYGIKTIFVWQPIPFYQYDMKFNPLINEGIRNDARFYRSIEVYPKIEALFKEGQLGNNFLWLAGMQQNLEKPLYVDAIHYSDEMSQNIASLIYDFIRTQTKPQSDFGTTPS